MNFAEQVALTMLADGLDFDMAQLALTIRAMKIPNEPITMHDNGVTIEVALADLKLLASTSAALGQKIQQVGGIARAGGGE